MVVIYQYEKQNNEFGRAWNDANNTRNNDIISYYEPFDGYYRTVPRKEFSQAFAMSNFSYLRLER